jgi:UPF0716 family protein affecting phage T7 exclusion
MKNDVTPIIISLGALWLVGYMMTFATFWFLLCPIFFIAAVILLFLGAIGPALGCLILIPIFWGIASFIMDKQDQKRMAEQNRLMWERQRQRETERNQDQEVIDETY